MGGVVPPPKPLGSMETNKKRKQKNCNISKCEEKGNVIWEYYHRGYYYTIISCKKHYQIFNQKSEKRRIT